MGTTDRYISSYPSLTTPEFKQTCLHLQSQFLSGGVASTWHSPRRSPWSTTTSEEAGYLSIRVYRTTDHDDDDDDDDDDDLEDDLEDNIDDPGLALAHPTSNVTPTTITDYHILLSPTYRIPTLYFRLSSPISAPAPATLLSGSPVSIVEHPLLGGTWWMVHPCMTGDAMMDVLDIDTGIGVEEYMSVWMGVVGSVVGLGIPLPLLRQ
ncbi:hypothetical protein YB2330_005517 [Saitoella coloradoensis]